MKIGNSNIYSENIFGLARFINLLVGICSMLLVSGCSVFESALSWGESSKSHLLIGSWATTEESEQAFVAEVEKVADEKLHFTIRYPEEDDPEPKIARVTFDANLIAEGNIHLLQIQLDSYTEHKRDGTSRKPINRGYEFLLTDISENTIRISHLNRDAASNIAFEVFRDAGLSFTASEFSGCLSWNARSSIAIESMSLIGDEGHWDTVLDALEISEEEFKATKQDVNRQQIDPYKQIAAIKRCVLHKLPTNALEQVFKSHTDGIFNDRVDVLVRTR